MPTAKKNKAIPCDDWENQDYDDPISDSLPSTQLESDQINPTTSPSANHAPVSPTLPSKASLDPIESENSEIWNNANRNPKYVVLPANASHSAVTANRPLVPETMFGKTKLTILKRPKPELNKKTTSNTSSISSGVSVSAREKAYQEARDRIFASSSPSSSDDQNSSSKSKSKSPHLSPDTSPSYSFPVHRQPIGPVALDQKGFTNRQKSVST